MCLQERDGQEMLPLKSENCESDCTYLAGDVRNSEHGMKPYGSRRQMTAVMLKRVVSDIQASTLECLHEL